ncbi:MAG: hypothetical protein ACKV2U_26955 [Bryobacteraceae bacterium]
MNLKSFVTVCLLLPASLLAEDTQCTGTLKGSHDNVIVPQGAVCDLVNARLNGSVYV